MATLFGILACLVLVGLAELARFLIARDSRATRIAGLVAGGVVAYLVAVALAFGMYRAGGVAEPDLEIRVKEVPAGFPASGKLQAGDWIYAVDGEPIRTSLNLMIDARNGAPVRLSFRRHGQPQEAVVQPIGHDGHWVIGVRPQIDHVRSYDVGRAASAAFAAPLAIAMHLSRPFSGRDVVADPGGPKRISDEYAPPPRPPGVEVLRTCTVWCVYVLLLVLAANLVRIALVVLRKPTA